MSVVQTQALSAEWKERLDLSLRVAPEFYEDALDAGRSPHAGAIRTALEDLGASAVFCVQDVPTIVIVVLDEYDRERIVDLHGALWNQGLATLLLVLTGNTVRAFSLARKPYTDASRIDSRCLVEELDAVANALAVKGLIYGAESGRLWQKHEEFFKPNERIDQVLLENLTVAHNVLCGEGLSAAGAQALLIQTMFIAYLEDREIVEPEYILEATRGAAKEFGTALESGNVAAFDALFRSLRKDFNGDLFVAPCSFEPDALYGGVSSRHLETLARFRSGKEEMRPDGGQLRLWGYNFKYIPIELISAVYDRFLGALGKERRRRGAYYTPMFLADTVISTLWDTLPEQNRHRRRILDPACGSGVFLVRFFQRLCENWRQTHQSKRIPWNSLLKLLSRLEGRDIDDGAVRVAVFSLYVALLQEVEPPGIRQLMKRGKLLPALWGRTLLAQDFFAASTDKLRADIVVGNPPWSSRGTSYGSAVKWCEEQGLPAPSKEGAWGFVWKALRHLNDSGVAAFLLPAMGFLHNHADNAVKARHRLAQDAQIIRIVNFADMRFQLFDKAVRPTALMVFQPGREGMPDYSFDYWVPKADLNLKMGRVITLGSTDKASVTSDQVKEDPFLFKRRLWISEPEEKLFNYMVGLPTLGDLALEFRTVHRRMETVKDRWVVGNGFQPVKEERLGENGYLAQRSELVSEIPYLPIERFHTLAQDQEYLRCFDDGHDGLVRRRGFERGFRGPRVLVPRGVSIKDRRLRASYVEAPLCFEDILVAVSSPPDGAPRAKLLAAILNSKLLFWFAFHATASFGSERPEVNQSELLRLPFPAVDDVGPDGPQVAEELVSLIDEAFTQADGFLLGSGKPESLDRLDRLCYQFFGLGEEEITLVEDAVDHVIPSVQPRRSTSVDLWQAPEQPERESYANMLARSLSPWFKAGAAVNVALEASNEDLALLRLRLVDDVERAPYRERGDPALSSALRRLHSGLDTPIPGNFQCVPDFRMFVGKSLYLVKPLQRRFWLRSAAIADADVLAADLEDAIRVGEVGDRN